MIKLFKNIIFNSRNDKAIQIILLFVLFLVSCKPLKCPTTYLKNNFLKKELTTSELQTWYQKDYQEDTIPGISLDKWYRLNKKKSKSKSIIVAVIDTQIDLKHEDLQDQIWINDKEIPNNGIDDDHNGYVDDINGWNFKGTKSGGYVVWSNYEYVRIVREWASIFKDKTKSQIDPKNLYKYKEYQRALKKLEEENPYYKNWFKSLNYKAVLYPMTKDTLKYFFPKEDYTYKQLDSLYKKYKINDKSFKQRRDDNDQDLGALIDCMKSCLEMNQNTLKDIQDMQTQLDSIVNKNVNINYNERLLIGDNPHILEKGYGQ